MSVTQAEVSAGLRYAGVIAGTLFTTAAALGALSPDTSQQIVADIQAVCDDLQKLVGDVWKLSVLLAPVITYWLAHLGVRSATPKSQIAAVQALPEAQVTVTNPKLAEGIPGVTVEVKK